jgi:hypothetical protein
VNVANNYESDHVDWVEIVTPYNDKIEVTYGRHNKAVVMEVLIPGTTLNTIRAGHIATAIIEGMALANHLSGKKYGSVCFQPPLGSPKTWS